MHISLKSLSFGRVALNAVVLTALISLGLFVPYKQAVSRVSPQIAATIEADDEFGKLPAVVAARDQAIKAELKLLNGHPWAGEYYEGDGLGANITVTLSPNAGVAATWRGCMGLYGANEGTLLAQPDGSLDFKFSRPNKNAFGGFPEEVVPVRWGERRYLIPESRMLAFINAIHMGFEPRPRGHGMFLLARGDELKQIDGLPVLPERFGQAIRIQPLNVAVVKVERLPDYNTESYCEKRYRLTVDHGELHGLVPGVELKSASPAEAQESFEITSADGRAAVGEMSIYEENCKAPKNVPDRTWTFTTGAYDPVVAKRQIEEGRP